MTHLHLLVIEFISWGPNLQHMSLLGENFMCLNIYRKMNVCGRAYVIPSTFRLSHLLVELSQIMRPVVRYQRYKLNIVPINSNCQFDTSYNLLRRESLFCIYLFMCLGILPAWTCVHHLNAWCPKRTKGAQEGTGSLGTGFQIIMGCHLCVRNQTWAFRAVNALSYWIISPSSPSP